MKQRTRFVILFLFIVIPFLAAQQPQKTWLQYKTPEEAGWSSEKLLEAKKLYDSLQSAAFMVVYRGKVLIAWGEIERRFMCHSIRKSYLSALYGIHVKEGRINLDATMRSLGITDNDSLSETEQQATIRDLLKARSGIYHSAAYETPSMKAARPARGSHAPNTFWYYNNWDFNVLGSIFREKTGKDIFQEFDVRFAKPLQMQDYRVTDGYYHLEAEHSKHPAYPFRMSARDMARFGLLFEQEGVWRGKEIVSPAWVKESTTSYSEARGGGYGYMWWVEGPEPMPGFYFALGAGGHVIGVSPSEDFVFVHRVNTYKRNSISYANAFRIATLVLAGKQSQPKEKPLSIELKPERKQWKTITVKKQERSGYWGTFMIDSTTVTVRDEKNRFVLQSPTEGTFTLLPLSSTEFLIEDMEEFLRYEFDAAGSLVKVWIEKERVN